MTNLPDDLLIDGFLGPRHARSGTLVKVPERRIGGLPCRTARILDPRPAISEGGDDSTLGDRVCRRAVDGPPTNADSDTDSDDADDDSGDQMLGWNSIGDFDGTSRSNSIRDFETRVREREREREREKQKTKMRTTRQ